VEWFRER
jgi:predicted transcriptional regulator